MWIGAEDKLPRRARAVFRNDPLQLRHQVEFSNWKLGPAVPAGAFVSAPAAKAKRIPFAHPDPKPPGLRRDNLQRAASPRNPGKGDSTSCTRSSAPSWVF